MFAEFSSIHMLKKSHFIFLLLVPIILELALSLQGNAYGHAVPDRYSFEPNSLIDTLQTFPDKISILFSERPDPKVSYIHVVDSKGQRIDNDDFKITGQRINSYDLNYRLGVTVNSSEIMAEHDSNENSMSKNLDPMHVPSEFTHVAILMSIVFASTSGFFFARGLKRLTIINRYLNIK